MKTTRLSAFILSVSLMLALVSGCASRASGEPQATGTPPPPASTMTAAAIVAAEQPNFVLLISDEPNDIADFAELWVTISGVGLVLGNEEGILEHMFTPTAVPLNELVGDAAIALWAGEVPEGEYTKIFIYVDEVWGILLQPEGEVVEIKLPSNKLHLDLSVTVQDEEPTAFVFDISVFKTGNSGQYILSPQLTESGQGKLYRINERAQERIRTGRPEWAGKPYSAAQGGDKHAVQTEEETLVVPGGNPDWSGSNQGQHDNESGRPDQSGRPHVGRALDDEESESDA